MFGFYNEWNIEDTNTFYDAPPSFSSFIKEAAAMLKPEKRISLQDTEYATVYRLGKGSIFYSNNDSFRLTYFSDYQVADVRRIGNSLGTTSLLLKLASEDLNEEEKVAFRTVNGLPIVIPYNDQLWMGHWTMVEHARLVQISDDAVRVIGADQPIISDPVSFYKEYPLQGMELVEQTGLLARFKVDGQDRLLHLEDLANADSKRLSDIWSTWVENPIIEQADPDQPFVSYSSPVLEIDWKCWQEGEECYTIEPIPDELHQAVGEVYFASDYGFARTFKKLGDYWYVLVEKELYQYENSKLQKLGNIPVTVSVSTGEASGGFGARDFIQAKDGWYFADTEGSRVIKLNSQFRLEAELPILFPHQLIAVDDGLRIITMTSELHVDWNLNVKQTNELNFDKASGMTELQLQNADSSYKDQHTGMLWYSLNGKLTQYKEKEKQYRSMYIGYNINFHGSVRIKPYKDEVLVVMDKRLERFDRTGNHIGSIIYPRAEPDGIYDQTPYGENSIVLDDEQGMLYLVQGYRILGIDLETGQVSTVFRQNYANIGKLQQKNGKLLFLLQSDIEYGYIYYNRHDPRRQSTDFYTELVEMDVQDDYKAKRYLMKGFFHQLKQGEAGELIFIQPYVY